MLYADPTGKYARDDDSGGRSGVDPEFCTAIGWRYDWVTDTCVPPPPPPNNESPWPDSNRKVQPRSDASVNPFQGNPEDWKPEVGTGTSGGLLGGKGKGAAALLLALCAAGLAAPFIPPAAQPPNQPPARRTTDDLFIGYHGTSSKHVPSILAGINPPQPGMNFGGGAQLGPGFYTSPQREMAEFFAKTAVRNLAIQQGDGGEPMLVKIYVRNFNQMKGRYVENKRSVNWENIDPRLMTQYDYLWSEVDGFRGKYQIKFNASAYPFLRAGEVIPVRRSGGNIGTA